MKAPCKESPTGTPYNDRRPVTRSGYTFTRDPLHARTFSEREALKHAADLAILYE